MNNTFTYNILTATTSPDNVQMMGAIDKRAALDLPMSFPFNDEASKRLLNPKLMAATITFENLNESLAIWAEEKDIFTLWVTSTMNPVRNITDITDLETCIDYFFDNEIDELSRFISELDVKYNP